MTTRTWFGVGAGLGVLVLAACAHPLPPAAAPGGPAPLVPAPLEASYDWHGLVTVPFGTLLKDSPVPLHEVLLFQDEAHPAKPPDRKDCYGVERAPPRFAGEQPDPYVLCFEHDRLNRIEAEVRLRSSQALGLFTRACAQWLGAAPAASGGTTCEGQDGPVAFSARIALVPGDAVTVLSMTLVSTTP